jgi:hypothetical protein
LIVDLCAKERMLRCAGQVVAGLCKGIFRWWFSSYL